MKLIAISTICVAILASGAAQANTVQIRGQCYFRCESIGTEIGAPLLGFFEIDDRFFVANERSEVEALVDYEFSSGGFRYDGSNAEVTSFYVSWGSEPGSIFSIDLFAFDSKSEARTAPLILFSAYRDFSGGARASLNGFNSDGIIALGDEAFFTVDRIAPVPLPAGGALLVTSICAALVLGRVRRGAQAQGQSRLAQLA